MLRKNTLLKLVDTQDLAYQLSNGEWLMSMPGTDEQKQGLLGCAQCHTLEPIVRSRYTAREFPRILDRMTRYAQGSTRVRPQLRPNKLRIVAARSRGNILG